MDGYRIHYEVEGPAPGYPVVLIHGLGGSADGWRSLAPLLKQGGFRVYMPDLIGFGSSEKPAAFSYSVRDESSIVVGFLNALRLKQVDLGGWSMGGWIVQLVAARNPERVRRLVLFDSAGLYQAPTWDTHLFTPANLEQLDQLDALLMTHPPRIPVFVAQDILRVSNQGDWVINRAMNQMWTAQDVTDSLLPHLNMPVLIEWGADDRIIPLNQGLKIHRLVPNSVLNVYAGCGHLAPLQCAGQMAPGIVSFLRGTAPGNPTNPSPSQPYEPTLGSPRSIAASEPAAN